MRFLLQIIIPLAVAAFTQEAQQTVKLQGNISDCTPTVQSAIGSLRRKDKSLQVACKDGFVREILAQENPAILGNSPQEFISAHWELFLPARPKHSLRFKRGRRGRQLFKGIEIFDSIIWSNHDPHAAKGVKGTWYCISVVDPSNWELSLTGRISLEKAVELVRQHGPTSGRWSYNPDSKHWGISKSFCGKSPALVWQVRAEERGHLNPEYNDERIFDVNAIDGRVCLWLNLPKRQNSWILPE